MKLKMKERINIHETTTKKPPRPNITFYSLDSGDLNVKKEGMIKGGGKDVSKRINKI